MFLKFPFIFYSLPFFSSFFSSVFSYFLSPSFLMSSLLFSFPSLFFCFLFFTFPFSFVFSFVFLSHLFPLSFLSFYSFLLFCRIFSSDLKNTLTAPTQMSMNHPMSILDTKLLHCHNYQVVVPVRIPSMGQTQQLGFRLWVK